MQLVARSFFALRGVTPELLDFPTFAENGSAELVVNIVHFLQIHYAFRIDLFCESQWLLHRKEQSKGKGNRYDTRHACGCRRI
jgi:hypothetical protein